MRHWLSCFDLRVIAAISQVRWVPTDCAVWEIGVTETVLHQGAQRPHCDRQFLVDRSIHVRGL